MKIRKEDKKKLKKLIQGSVIERKFETTETSAKSDAIKQYAIWGEKSDYLTRPTVNEVKKMDGDFLIDQIKDAMSVETTVFYTGTVKKDVVRNSIKEYFMIIEIYTMVVHIKIKI